MQGLHCGELHKLPAGARSDADGSDYWFVLHPSSLSCHVDAEAAMRTRTVLSVSLSAEARAASVSVAGERGHAFEITSPGSPALTVCAPSAEARTQWLRAVGAVLALKRAGSVQAEAGAGAGVANEAAATTTGQEAGPRDEGVLELIESAAKTADALAAAGGDALVHATVDEADEAQVRAALTRAGDWAMVDAACAALPGIGAGSALARVGETSVALKPFATSVETLSGSLSFRVAPSRVGTLEALCDAGSRAATGSGSTSLATPAAPSPGTDAYADGAADDAQVWRSVSVHVRDGRLRCEVEQSGETVTLRDISLGTCRLSTYSQPLRRGARAQCVCVREDGSEDAAAPPAGAGGGPGVVLRSATWDHLVEWAGFLCHAIDVARGGCQVQMLAAHAGWLEAQKQQQNAADQKSQLDWFAADDVEQAAAAADEEATASLLDAREQLQRVHTLACAGESYAHATLVDIATAAGVVVETEAPLAAPSSPSPADAQDAQSPGLATPPPTKATEDMHAASARNMRRRSWALTAHQVIVGSEASGAGGEDTSSDSPSALATKAVSKRSVGNIFQAATQRAEATLAPKEVSKRSVGNIFQVATQRAEASLSGKTAAAAADAATPAPLPASSADPHLDDDMATDRPMLRRQLTSPRDDEEEDAAEADPENAALAAVAAHAAAEAEAARAASESSSAASSASSSGDEGQTESLLEEVSSLEQRLHAASIATAAQLQQMQPSPASSTSQPDEVNLGALTVRELKSRLDNLSIDYSTFIEKSEFVAALKSETSMSTGVRRKTSLFHSISPQTKGLRDEELVKLQKKGYTKFNIKASSGIKFLVSNNVIEDSPHAIAAFFHGHQQHLGKKRIGEYLGAAAHGDVLDQYVQLFDFDGITLDEAMRSFLLGFRLPGEAQQIDRILEKFAGHFYQYEGNQGPFASADTAYILAFSIIMLNTDLHNPSIRADKKMTVDQFVNNNRGINGGKDLPREVLETLYENIKSNEIKMQDADMAESDVVTFMAPTMQGWLSKQGTGTFAGWKKHWFVLADACLYYFAKQGDQDPRCIIPLDNCGVKILRSSDNALSVFCKQEYGRIKSVKVLPNGSRELGEHRHFLLKAPSREDRDRWVQKLSEEMAVDDSAFHAQVQRQSTDKPVSLHSGAPQLEGWMFKTPQHRDTKWQRRYCTLHLEKPARMYYFSKQADAAQMQRQRYNGFVELGTIRHVEINEYLKSPARVIVMQAASRRWLFSPEDPAMVEPWLEQLADVVQASRQIAKSADGEGGDGGGAVAYG